MARNSETSGKRGSAAGERTWATIRGVSAGCSFAALTCATGLPSGPNHATFASIANNAVRRHRTMPRTAGRLRVVIVVLTRFQSSTRRVCGGQVLREPARKAGVIKDESSRPGSVQAIRWPPRPRAGSPASGAARRPCGWFSSTSPCRSGRASWSGQACPGA